MRATSLIQFEASRDGSVPPIEQVRPDVWAVALPVPGTHLPYSLVYVLKDSDGALHLVDSGWDSDENAARLDAALRDIAGGAPEVRQILLTHLHPDHTGLASRLRQTYGARVRASTADGRLPADDVPVEELLTLWGVPAAAAAELLDSPPPDTDWSPAMTDDIADLERFSAPGFDLLARLTPGHTAGHATFVDERRGLVFTGDHVLPNVFAGVGLGGATAGNALADYLHSLEVVAAWDDFECLPGHGYRFRGLGARAAESREHHLRRTREVAAIVGADPTLSNWSLASRLTWTAGWERLHGFQLYSALRQTAIHRDFVAAGHPLDQLNVQ